MTATMTINGRQIIDGVFTADQSKLDRLAEKAKSLLNSTKDIIVNGVVLTRKQLRRMKHWSQAKLEKFAATTFGEAFLFCLAYLSAFFIGYFAFILLLVAIFG